MGIDFALVSGIDTDNIIIPLLSRGIKEVESEENHTHQQKIYRFDNGYGISAVRSRSGYRRSIFYDCDSELYDIAIIRFKSDGDFVKTFDTSINRGRIETYTYIGEDSLQRLLRHTRSMNASGNFRGVGRPADIGCYYSDL